MQAFYGTVEQTVCRATSTRSKPVGGSSLTQRRLALNCVTAAYIVQQISHWDRRKFQQSRETSTMTGKALHNASLKTFNTQATVYKSFHNILWSE